MSFVEWASIVAIGIVIFGAAFSVLISSRKIRRVQHAAELVIPDCLPRDGVDVPLLAAYAGWKTLGTLTFAENNIRPELHLFDDRLAYKVFRHRGASYSDIEFVKGISQRFFNRMRFGFRDCSLSFIVDLADELEYQAVEDFLRRKGVPIETRN